MPISKNSLEESIANALRAMQDSIAVRKGSNGEYRITGVPHYLTSQEVARRAEARADKKRLLLEKWSDKTIELFSVLQGPGLTPDMRASVADILQSCYDEGINDGY